MVVKTSKIRPDPETSEFGEVLPEGFETPLGKRGLKFFGAQQQRLAIARGGSYPEHHQIYTGAPS